MLFLADTIKITHQQYNDIGCGARSIPVLASVSERKAKTLRAQREIIN